MKPYKKYLCIRCAIGLMDDHKMTRIGEDKHPLERGECHDCGRDSWGDWYVIEESEKLSVNAL